jgi:hypothetical protein
MRFYRSKVFSFWRHAPGEKAKLMALDARWLWQPSVVETRGRPGAGSWLDRARSWAEPVWAVTIFALGIAGAFLVSRVYLVLALLLLLYETIVAMAFVGATRYRVPWDFLIALLAGAAAVELARRLRPWRASTGSTSDTGSTREPAPSSSSAATSAPD